MKLLARIALTTALASLLGAEAEARPLEERVAGGAEVRNGDWLALEPVSLTLLAGSGDGPNVASSARVVLGLGGAGLGVGLATGLGGPCVEPAPCALRDSLFSSIVGIEARLERMYGPTTWRHTAYLGPQLSFAGIFGKFSVGWMFDVKDKADNHFQFGLGGGW
jgi:hypothetical protein